MPTPKLAVIGLDCAEPSLVFDRFAADLPTLSALRRSGLWGKLRSCDPPITCPAWMVMVTGRTPGELGIYGFRNRTDRSYTGLGLATSAWIKTDTVWDVAGRAGKDCISFAVPLTFPPKPIRGSQISCWLTPGNESAFAQPPELKAEINRAVGPYLPDVKFRVEDKQQLYDDLKRTTDNHFAIAEHLLAKKPWDFFMMVEMGTDRIHHAFWKYFDESHPRHPKGNPQQGWMREYYASIDARIAKLLERIPDDAWVAVVSDHGIKGMLGGICFNEWLAKEGYLTLLERPAKKEQIGKCRIDWSKTKAWGDGGYYGRLFLNVRGREPQGLVAPEDVEPLRRELADKLEALADEQGDNIGTRVLYPEKLYPKVEGIAPDLIVYFGDLAWRSMGSIGGPDDSIYTYENDTGPDDANHAPDGIFMLSTKARMKAGLKGPGERQGLQIHDCAPTFLKLLGVPPSPQIGGQPFDLAGLA
ncbi:MAG: alkaline phosphatase family protein [Planctomycetota bacterium]|nr:alkaline phosphatase family protein [Planctomycetota bacterium]